MPFLGHVRRSERPVKVSVVAVLGSALPLSVDFRLLLVNRNEKGIPAFEAQLVEVGPRNDQSQIVAFVDHLDFQNTAHGIPYAIRGYKTSGFIEFQNTLDSVMKLSLRESY